MEMRKTDVALRVEPSLVEELSALRTTDYFRERAGRADMARAIQILEVAGKGAPPVEGDEILDI